MTSPAVPPFLTPDAGPASGVGRATPLGRGPEVQKGRVIRGAMLSYMAQGMKLAVQITSVIVLSRLLTPADFGLYAMVTPIYGLLLMFQDFGLSDATVQRSEISSAQVTALFWVTVAVSIVLALILCAASPTIGWFYGDPRASDLALGFAVIIVIFALAAQHLALISRGMRFGYLAGLDIAASLAGLLGSLTVALLLGNYWALLAAPACDSIVTVIGAWIGTRWIPGRPRWQRDAGDLLRFGGGLTGFSLFNFVARNLDNVLIGYAWGNVALGLYNRAYRLLLFPLLQVSNPMERVMMPTLARLRHEPERYRRAYLRTVQQILLVTQPGIVFTIATVDTLVPTLLGNQWTGVAPIFAWLGLTAMFQPMNSTISWLFISQGRGKAYLFWGAFNASICTAAFAAGLSWGPVGVAAAYTIAQLLVGLPVLWWMSTRRGPVTMRDLYATAIPFTVASAVAFGAIVALRTIVTTDGIPMLGAALFVSYAVAGAVLLTMPVGRRTLGETASLAVGMLRPR